MLVPAADISGAADGAIIVQFDRPMRFAGDLGMGTLKLEGAWPSNVTVPSIVVVPLRRKTVSAPASTKLPPAMVTFEKLLFPARVSMTPPVSVSSVPPEMCAASRSTIESAPLAPIVPELAMISASKIVPPAEAWMRPSW